jgi:hypothetical protein
MSEETRCKMYEIAKYLGELNAKDKVKKFGGEKGYAKVYQIIPGCSIWVHHLSNDRLIIDLQIGEAASDKFSEEGLNGEAELIKKFKNFFNNEVSQETFYHPLDGSGAVRYYKNISDEPLNSILERLQELEQNFSNSR